MEGPRLTFDTNYKRIKGGHDYSSVTLRTFSSTRVQHKWGVRLLTFAVERQHGEGGPRRHSSFSLSTCDRWVWRRISSSRRGPAVCVPRSGRACPRRAALRRLPSGTGVRQDILMLWGPRVGFCFRLVADETQQLMKTEMVVSHSLTVRRSGTTSSAWWRSLIYHFWSRSNVSLKTASKKKKIF